MQQVLVVSVGLGQAERSQLLLQRDCEQGVAAVQCRSRLPEAACLLTYASTGVRTSSHMHRMMPQICYSDKLSSVLSTVASTN